MGLNVGSISGVTDINSMPAEILETSELLFDYKKDIKTHKYGKDKLGNLTKNGEFINVAAEEDKTKEAHVCSYSDYDKFRDVLSQVSMGVTQQEVWEDVDSGGKKYEGQPCFELVDFADNEGVMCADTAAKLAKDFDEVKSKFVNWSWESDMTKSTYVKIFDQIHDNLRRAADNGVFYFFIKN